MKYTLNETDKQRFWSKVQKADGCWTWLGGFYPSGRPGFWLGHNNVLAYRVSYTLCVGDIPEGKQMDHVVCDNRACVNPYHVQPSTARDNVMRSNAVTALNGRKTACKRGHPLTAKTSGAYFRKHGWRNCPTCAIEQQRERRAELRKLAEFGRLCTAQGLTPKVTPS